MRRSWIVHCSPASLSEVERRLRTRDITLRVPTKSGNVRLVYANTRNLLKETIRRHQLGTRTHGHRSFLELVGSHLTFTNILAALQEGEERVISRFTADHATIITESLALGESRCYIRGENNESNIDLTPFPLKVDRILYGQRQPFSSMTAARLDNLICDNEEEDSVGGGLDISTSNNNNNTMKQVPRALGLQDLPHELLQEYFRYNISLHGYNFFRQSEGAAVALWCSSHLRDISIEEILNQFAHNNSSQTLEKELEMQIERAGCSYGILVQPLVAQHAEELKVHQLQRTLLQASIANPNIFRVLYRRAQEDCLTCQDTLSLVSGDYEGAYTVALAARQCTQDPSIVAPIMEALRQQLGLEDILRLQLDTNSVVRNGLDFFCRCSKENFMQSVITLSVGELVRLKEETNFHCTFCGKDHPLRREDWEKVMQEKRENEKGSSIDYNRSE
ncbi:Heat shock protein Hsp33 [Trypanosoma melophagium]|uniref:Heat shock protein Hsp33 n=1 Tax=Trypanosoma melophagium TaxID=715481 RepID=UPI003519D90D|nr:Heat shock protein Hsp33 [Trypanosoma melophagium]